jgi:hypothetical protein
VSNIFFGITYGDVHCNVCGVKIAIKKVGFLRASIAPIIGDLFLFFCQGKMVGSCGGYVGSYGS